MTNILLIALLSVNVAVLALVALFALKIRAAHRAFTTFITSPGENQPSPLAQTTGAMADMVARSLVAQAKATFMGLQSGNSRAEKAIEADMAEDLIAQKSPLAGAIMSSFPSLRRTLRRNPQLIDLAMQEMAKRGAGPAATADNGGGNRGQIPFSL